MPVKMSFAERYDKLAFPEPNSGCFIWMGHLDKNGYGTMKVGYLAEGNRRTEWAHRAAYEYFVEMDLDHKCRVRCCVNPDHLEPVTHIENCRRGIAGEVVRARSAAQTHCKNGHPLSGENLAMYGGARCCRVCRLAGARRRWKGRRSGK